jgi:hypothetical protein
VFTFSKLFTSEHLDVREELKVWVGKFSKDNSKGLFSAYED